MPDELHSKISLRIPREPASLPLPLHDTRSQPCVWCTWPHLPGPAAQPGDWVSPVTSSLPPNPGSHTDSSRALPSGHQVIVPHKDQGSAGRARGTTGHLSSTTRSRAHVGRVPKVARSLQRGKWLYYALAKCTRVRTCQVTSLALKIR